MATCKTGCRCKPPWIRVRLGTQSGLYQATHERLRAHGLHTVCEEALCPNKGRCWAHGRATLLILGDRCTRGCRFCNVDKRTVLNGPKISMFGTDKNGSPLSCGRDAHAPFYCRTSKERGHLARRSRDGSATLLSWERGRRRSQAINLSIATTEH